MVRKELATLTEDELACRLSAWAEGSFAVEAAVEMLVGHRHWLTRLDFRRELVETVDDGWGSAGVVPMAVIDWDRVTPFLQTAPCSQSEQSMLVMAASLAGGSSEASLLSMTTGLDDRNATLVIHALCHRFGWHRPESTAAPVHSQSCRFRTPMACASGVVR